jgi:hypothetical protein
MAGATENYDDAQPQPQTDRIRSLSISLEPLRDHELAPPAAMHKQVWKWLDYSIRKFATRKANQQVFGYLAAEVKDGFDQGLWTSSSASLTFAFPDTAGGYRMSSYAALHWLEMMFAYTYHSEKKRTDTYHGYRIAAPVRPVGELLATGPAYPLVEIDGLLYCIDRPASVGDAITIFTDELPTFTDRFHEWVLDMLQPVSSLEEASSLFNLNEQFPKARFEDLQAKQRTLVEEAAQTGQCQCQVCQILRKRVAKRTSF